MIIIMGSSIFKYKEKILLIVMIFSIFQLNTSCKTQYSTKELRNNFSSQQINDLEKIVEFYKKQICLNESLNFKVCYKKLPHEYMEAVGSPVWSNINFERQKELYGQISQSTFDEIWDLTYATYTDGSVLKAISSKYNGGYQKYLKDLGKRNDAIKEYAKEVIAAGDYAPAYLHYSNIIKLKRYFDLNDPNVQLIMAIHFLSLNDDLKRGGK